MSANIPDITKNIFREIIDRHKTIKEIWLFGSRANGNETNNSDWDLLIIANEEVLKAISEEKENNYKGLDILVVFDGDHFRGPWPRQEDGRYKSGSLIGYEWVQLNSNMAEYKGTKYNDEDKDIIVTRCKAIKIYDSNGGV